MARPSNGDCMPMGTIMTYFCSYIFVHASCQVITCSLPMFASDPALDGSWTTTDSGILLGYASLAAGVGFGVWGPLIDHVGTRHGPTFGLGCSLYLNFLGVWMLSKAESKVGLTLGCLMIRLAYSAGFPSEIKAIQLTVPDKYQTTALSMLGFGSRCGAILGRALFGALLRHFTWRAVARGMAALLLLAATATVLRVNGLLAKAAAAASPAAKRSESGGGFAGHMSALLKEPAVHMLAVGFSLLCYIMHGDDLMPLLFFGLTGNPLSISLSAVFPLGGICAMILNATQSHKVTSKERKEWFYVHTIAGAIAALTALWLLTCAAGAGNVALPIVMVLIFITGFTAAPPYYLLANVFAMEIGGEDSSTLVSIYELVAFLTKSPVHAKILWIADRWGWEHAIMVLLLIALSAFVAMFLFVNRWHRVLRKKHAFVSNY
eukprot:CAMPEP_0179162826 /NCGR_PEP_ID=MMETSP0796-20121207/79782_1 /TAXON_ID=73915 /ORGANISM="Pyrodinium bahamense, Strain pbaha01" /LENGTH=433 /DNA_ID=CAMNT_0020865053 /DNA_START=1 /DNA_END=1299 /DNA_ORIENTATION=-